MIKFILSSFLFLLILGISPSASQVFNPVIGNNGFATSADLRSSYSQEGQDGAHIADVFFKTKIPSFNLDQNGVAGIDCKDNKITINLNDASPIKQIQNWPDKILLFVSHRWNCFGEQTTQYYTIGDRVIDPSNTKVTFTSEKIDIKDMSDEFSINISWDNGGNKKRRVRRRSNKRAVVSNKVDLNILFDVATGKSSEPNFSLINLEQNDTSESVVCTNCFTKGEATISLNLAGKLSPSFELTDATISVDGNIQFNFDMAINGTIRASIIPFDVQILSIPLSPFAVPELFNVGPSIDLGVSTKLSTDLTGTLNIGSEIDYKNFSTKATFVDTPQFEQSGFEPQILTHESSVGLTASGSISGSLKPQLAFGLSAIGGLFSLKVGFGIITTLETKVTIGSESGCTNVTQSHLESKVDGNLGFFIRSENFPILDFPPVTLSDKCV